MDDAVLHICLAGSKIRNDRQLIQALTPAYTVTLMKREFLLANKRSIATVDVLVLDCNESDDLTDEIYPIIKKVKNAFPEIVVLLVDGGLSQPQIATAFQAGVQDYFSEPYDIKLLTERLQVFGVRVKTSS